MTRLYTGGQQSKVKVTAGRGEDVHVDSGVSSLPSSFHWCSVGLAAVGFGDLKIRFIEASERIGHIVSAFRTGRYICSLTCGVNLVLAGGVRSQIMPSRWSLLHSVGWSMTVSSWYWKGSPVTLNRVTNLTGYCVTSSGWMISVAAVTSCELSVCTRYRVSPVHNNTGTKQSLYERYKISNHISAQMWFFCHGLHRFTRQRSTTCQTDFLCNF